MMEEMCKTFFEKLFSSIAPMKTPNLTSASCAAEVSPTKMEKAIGAMKQKKALDTDRIGMKEIRAGRDNLKNRWVLRFRFG